MTKTRAGRKIRTFQTGATRDASANKPDYEGYLSPIVLERFGKYMLKHQTQSDGAERTSDNWQKGIPREEYIKSLIRHALQLWLWHDGYGHLSDESLEDSLCAIMFNAQGYLFEELKASRAKHGENELL